MDWTGLIPAVFILAVELLFRLIERIPDRDKREAETKSERAAAIKDLSDSVETLGGELAKFHALFLAESAAHENTRTKLATARARLARCTCGEAIDTKDDP